MTKEELIKLKDDIATLSEEDKKERDLYLRGLANGDIQGPPVGYPSIDKPWLKYYSKENIDYDIPKCTCYEFLYENNKDHLDNIAIDYYGKKITYKELFDNIKKTKKSLESIGVKKGDIVSLVAVHTPEVIYSFYALNRIGAISNFIDPRSNVTALENYFSEVNSKYVLTVDLFTDKVAATNPSTKIDKIVEINPVNSAPFYIRMFQKKKHNKKSDSRILDWNEFIEAGKNVSPSEDFKYKKDYPATIVHTGGTTGKPKGVLLSNDDFSGVVCETKNTPLPLNRQDKFMNITVPFVAFGLALGMHTPMTLGWKSVLIPDYTIDKMNKLMKKHKPQLVMGTQTYYEPLLECDDYDYSHTKVLLTGGMPTKEEFEKKINQKIKDNNGDFTISKGYSMTEASSMGTCSYTGVNEYGSNGVPLSKTNISAFAPDDNHEMMYDQAGEICINTPTMMLGYYNNEEETSKVIKEHSDGTKWVHSGDIGYVTQDGFVHIKGRIKRMIIKSGFKIFPSEIEESYVKHPLVKNCSVVAMDDSRDGSVPVAFIVLEDENADVNEIEKDLRQYIEKDGMPSYFEPQKFFYIEHLPITSVGKVNYRELESIANNNEAKKVLIKK